jgi:hypothetical protein
MMDVEQVLHSPLPLDAYYIPLARRYTARMFDEAINDPGMTNSSSAHQEGNWNGEQKSIYIMATR